jgi:hypothetical protein
MEVMYRANRPVLLLATLIIVVGTPAMFEWVRAKSAMAASPLYWCPNEKPDQQYSSKPRPGCVPWVEKKERAEQPRQDDATPSKPAPREMKIENLQSEVSDFLQKYRRFLDCCKTDFNELQQVEELGDEVSGLLEFAQANLSNHSMASRGIMLREMIGSVAKARADLHTLHANLERINTLRERQGSLDFEEAGRDSRAIQDTEEAINKGIRAPRLSTGPKTGADIGMAPAAGPNIGKTPTTGTAIGAQGLVGPDAGASSKNSQEIGASGPTGFGIGATGRAGPAIGESSINSESSSSVGSSLQQSTVGSSLSDSTVGSSLGPSNVGSNLPDSTVGSSFGSSSVGSTLQDRRTAPQQ